MEKPILFNTEMVKAILEGRKTCTRRVLKQPFEVHPNGFITKRKGNERLIPYEAPYKVGDILYVRETWKKFKKRVGSGESCYVKGFYGYKADEDNPNNPSEFYDGKWKPSIHMPKEAARIFLKVRGVTVERIKDISEKQAINEGVGDLFLDYIANCEEEKYKVPMEYETLAIDQFELLWNSTIKKSDIDKYSWDANPYVWVIQFEVIENV